MILAAMAMGVEYAWVQQGSAGKGVRPRRFLVVKTLSLMAVVGIGHLVVILAMGISSLIISYTLTDTGVATNAVQWFRTGADVIKSMYAMLPFVIMGMFFAILTSSPSSGIVISVLFFLCEVILKGVLGTFLGPDAAGF